LDGFTVDASLNRCADGKHRVGATKRVFER